MNDINYINSILTAVDEINLLSKKKKNTNVSSSQNFIPKLNKNSKIPTDINNIISEAEEYKKKPSIEHATNDLTEDNNLHKEISNLNFKIEDLGKELKKLKLVYEDKTTLDSKAVNSINILEVTIDNLNKKITKFKKTEDQLNSQILGIMQNNSIITQKNKNLEYLYNSTKITKNDKDTRIFLISIYNKVKKYKKIFLHLRNILLNAERDLNFYKKNYERLDIQNDTLKKNR